MRVLPDHGRGILAGYSRLQCRGHARLIIHNSSTDQEYGMLASAGDDAGRTDPGAGVSRGRGQLWQLRLDHKGKRSSSTSRARRSYPAADSGSPLLAVLCGSDAWVTQPPPSEGLLPDLGADGPGTQDGGSNWMRRGAPAAIRVLVWDRRASAFRTHEQTRRQLKPRCRSRRGCGRHVQAAFPATQHPPAGSGPGCVKKAFARPAWRAELADRQAQEY